MPDALIEARDVGKKFPIRQRDNRRYGLRDFGHIALGLSRPLALREGEFWALKDVSFAVRPGENLAVLGRNGAGKSTLLTMMTGRMLPDAGSLTVRGRVGVLAIGQFGFRMNMTGRENILLKAIALGLRKREIEPLVPAIIEFAELGDFIDAPMRTYSSGMVARLGFAVAINVQPEILLADEALSAGDAAFAQKCARSIEAMRQRMTFVVVTHSAAFAAQLCQQGLVLDKGRVAFLGPVAEAAAYYEQQVVGGAKPSTSA